MPQPSADNSILVCCTQCKGKFRAGSALRGKELACPKCGEKLHIPPLEEAPQAERAADVAKRPEKPQYIGFKCLVCETRMNARARFVGWKIKCPDCGTTATVPPLPSPKVKKTPAALSGDQYEVWPVENQPTGVDLVAAEPPYVSFECSLCQTRLSARHEQIGEPLQCPDCGAKTRVPANEEAPPVQEIAEAYDLDETSAPGVQPAVVYPKTHQRIYEQANATDKHASVNVPGARSIKPHMPKLPLLSGVFTFPFYGTPLWRVCSIGSSLVVVWFFLQLTLSMMGAGKMAVMGVLTALPTILLGTAWFSYACAHWLVIMGETSVGNSRIEGWPGILLTEWFFDGLSIAMAASVSCFPGYVIGRFLMAEAPIEEYGLMFGGLFLLCFPVVLLSMLEGGSLWAVLSPPVVKSLFRTPIAWFFFTIESCAIAITLFLCIAAVQAFGALALLIAAPCVVAVTFVYFRLLGRFAWCLARSSRAE